MQRSADNRRRLISVTEGNLRNSHLYITGHHDFFPQECYGQSSEKKGAGRTLTLLVEGFEKPVETDIARGTGDGELRNFFRKRAWVGKFLRQHRLRAGDLIALERIDPFTYRIGPHRTFGHVTAGGNRENQPTLFPGVPQTDRQDSPSAFGDTAFTRNRQEPLHRWVPWIAGFSASFIQEVFRAANLGNSADVTVLDPFAGVGTTLVEGLKQGYNVVGFEINPYAALACEVKISCARQKLRPLGEALASLDELAARVPHATLEPKSRPPSGFKSRVPFFSPSIERDVLWLQDFIQEQKSPFVRKALKLALGSVMVAFSNYSYEPSLSTRSAAGRGSIDRADVFGTFRGKLREIEEDMSLLQQRLKRFKHKPETAIYQRSYLTGGNCVDSHSVDVLVTSPPYLNNYHYVRNTRPQLYWLGLTDGNGDLKRLEENNFGQFWQTVRSGPRVELTVKLPELVCVLDAIRERNPEKGVYGGVGWANYAATYFNDCARFFEVTRQLMKPGGLVVVVIGNNIVQGVHVETDRFLAEIAGLYGFRLERMHQVRRKRTGSSIVKSSVRAGVTKAAVELYETAVELRFER
ncbi:MAG TPA: DNA methyltransferase [Sedimentisphaerales bacterium]|nr:DNA methyltransferase [Sedimentisphaerales bacterium]